MATIPDYDTAIPYHTRVRFQEEELKLHPPRHIALGPHAVLAQVTVEAVERLAQVPVPVRQESCVPGAGRTTTITGAGTGAATGAGSGSGAGC